jgi:diketogulonate reductase-like aldo/keto reductase
MKRTREVRGIEVPSFMYGTAWKEDHTEELTLRALNAGFTAIDTANQRRHYFEAGVGAAVAKFLATGGLTREQLFLQTKFTYVRGQDARLPYDPTSPLGTQVQQSFDSSLEHLGTSYVDSYVLHGPSVGRGLSEDDREVWKAMEAIHASGKTRLLGVSNVTLEQLEAFHHLSSVPIAFVQNRCFARTGWDRAVRVFCDRNGIVYQGFSLLTANDRELRTRDVRAIVEKHGRTLPQVVFRFALSVGMLPLTGTSDPEHMREDLEAFDFELSAEELAVIERVAS